MHFHLQVKLRALDLEFKKISNTTITVDLKLTACFFFLFFFRKLKQRNMTVFFPFGHLQQMFSQPPTTRQQVIQTDGRLTARVFF